MKFAKPNWFNVPKTPFADIPNVDNITEESDDVKNEQK